MNNKFLLDWNIVIEVVSKNNNSLLQNEIMH